MQNSLLVNITDKLVPQMNTHPKNKEYNTNFIILINFPSGVRHNIIQSLTITFNLNNFSTATMVTLGFYDVFLIHCIILNLIKLLEKFDQNYYNSFTFFLFFAPKQTFPHDHEIFSSLLLLSCSVSSFP